MITKSIEMGVIIKFVVNAAKVDLSDVTENARYIRTPPQESVPLLVLLVLHNDFCSIS